MVSTGLHVIGQIKVRNSEVEFLGSTSKCKKKNKKKSLFTSSTICPIGTFHVVIEQREMYKKSTMHVQSCSFSYQTYCLFDVPIAIGVVGALNPWYLSETITFTVFSCHDRKKDFPRGW